MCLYTSCVYYLSPGLNAIALPDYTILQPVWSSEVQTCIVHHHLFKLISNHTSQCRVYLIYDLVPSMWGCTMYGRLHLQNLTVFHQSVFLNSQLCMKVISIGTHLSVYCTSSYSFNL